MTKRDTVDAYCERFWSAFLPASSFKKISFKEQIERFTLGLPTEIRDHCLEQKSASIQELMSHAKRGFTIHSGTLTYPTDDGMTQRDDQFAGNDTRNRKHYPEKKDARPKLTPQERSRLIREGKCFGCGEPGHISAKCPKKAPKEQKEKDEDRPESSRAAEERGRRGKMKTGLVPDCVGTDPSTMDESTKLCRAWGKVKDQEALIFFDGGAKIFRLHGMLETIVFDRDPRFTSLFWKEIWENIGTRLQFSSSFHPQTDGQSEIANSVVLDLLKFYISDQKTQWERYLPLVEFAYNNTIHSLTGKAPFEIVEGAMKVPPFLSTKDKIFEADEYTRDLDTAFAKVRETLQKSQERQKKAADCHRRDLKLKENDWVLLRFEKACLRKKKGKERFFPKLSMRYYGPFQITERINDVSFRLRLPDTWKIHNAFHVSLLNLFEVMCLMMGSLMSNPKWKRMRRSLFLNRYWHIRIRKRKNSHTPSTNSHDSSPMVAVLRPKDVSIGLKTCLFIAAREGNYEQLGINPNARDRKAKTPFHEACAHGHTDCATLLLENGALISAHKTNGFTPLHYAAAGGHEAIVELLVSRGIDLNEGDYKGERPLDLAARVGAVGVIHILLCNGADVLRRTRNGRSRWTFDCGAVVSPGRSERGSKGFEWVDSTILGSKGQLDVVKSKGQLDVVKFLLHEAGADACTSNNHRSALHVSAGWGYLAICEELLAGGADSKAKDKDGLEPADVAQKCGHLTIFKLLTE
ncbi:hypothetical protein L7F22_003594 [Adiantum nelumboides]|nr:hypothetical protein [Adiantum nelumboides]